MKLKIPPVVIFFLALALMFGAYYLFPGYTYTVPYSISFSRVLLVMGSLAGIAGIVEFRSKGTTIDPMNPQKARRLVTSGIYRYSRNPMYLGMLLVLLGGLIRLGSPLSLPGVLFYIFCITQFQIKAEEKALSQNFGDEYRDYCDEVRRWI